MKKIIIIAIIVVLIIIIGTVIFFSTEKGVVGVPPASTSTAGVLPYVTTSSVAAEHPTGTILQIGTAGGTVMVNNFYNNPVQVSEDNTSVVVAQSSTYNITYYAPDSSFNIGILKGPVSVTQPEAEADFLKVLGISEADACKLNVIIGVPYSVDPNYADKNLGLSFCSGGAFQAK